MKKGMYKIKGGTFLSDFIRRKADGYIEPTRKGTPKGEPVGLSKIKYTAALLMLTNQKLYDIAETLDLSYGLVRLWKTESFFTTTVLDLKEEFIEKLNLHIEGKLIEYRRGISNLHSGKGNKELQLPVFDELSDAEDYNYSIKTRVLDTLIPSEYLGKLNAMKPDKLSLEDTISESIDLWNRLIVIKILKLESIEHVFKTILKTMQKVRKQLMKALMEKNCGMYAKRKFDNYDRISLFLIQSNYKEDLI